MVCFAVFSESANALNYSIYITKLKLMLGIFPQQYQLIRTFFKGKTHKKIHGLYVHK